MREWAELIRLLSGSVDFIAIDLPGFGESPLRHPRTVRALVLLGTLGTPAHGSYRLLALPGMAKLMRWLSLSLRWRHLAPLHRLIFRRVLRDILHPRAVSPQDIARELEVIAAHPTILEAMVAVTRDNPCLILQRNAPRIECETHFVHGAEDALVPIAHARNVHRLMPAAGGRSYLVSLPNAGHMLHRFEAPQIAAYLASVLAGL